MIFMAIAVGSNIGCSVLISQYFGAKWYKEMKTAVSTTLLASLTLSAVLTAVGLAGSRGLMIMINTPDNIFADGDLYLRIYIGGFVFLFLYNVATGIFTSLGDSKTFLAQGIACVLALITLKKRLASIHTEEKAEVFSWNMLGKISRIAVPSILQQSFISIGNIFIQGLINSFGSSVIAGYSAAVKLNTFAITSLTTLGNGTSSFAAQNLGAGKQERVEQGFRASVKLALIITVPFFAAFFFGSHAMLSLFMNEGSTIAMETGTQFLRIVSPFYFVISLKLMADGVLRGAGAMKSFMIATFTDLFLRVILAFLLSVRFGTMGIWLSWPIGWTIAMALSLFFYKKGVWKTGSFTAREEQMEEAVMERESESAFLYPEE